MLLGGMLILVLAPTLLQLEKGVVAQTVKVRRHHRAVD